MGAKMSSSFQDFWRIHKPILDEAFRRQISDLLENISLQQMPALMATLEAGKKIRGCLVCLITNALGGELDSAIPRAVAIELIQAATLIHDDFVDQDTIRGNRPAAWTLEGARRAVLIGDIIFATAIKMMADLSREDGSAVSQAIAKVSKGALHEPWNPLVLAEEIEADGSGDQLYDQIIRLKTGILFGTACHLGALAGNGDGKLAEITFRYGLRIGEAYQIADDLKEVEHHLMKRSIDSGQMVALAPALLHFVPELRPIVLSRLRGGNAGLEASEAEYFRAAVKSMKNQIEQRLQTAVSEVAESFPNNGYKAAVIRAPWDLIRMFNES
jgi:geranylgeranyl pyrophosphate synthase